jgi:hypothetical protein
VVICQEYHAIFSAQPPPQAGYPASVSCDLGETDWKVPYRVL